MSQTEEKKDQNNKSEKNSEESAQETLSSGTLSLGGTLSADDLSKKLDKSGKAGVTVEVKRRSGGKTKTKIAGEETSKPNVSSDDRRLKALKASQQKEQEPKKKAWETDSKIEDRIVIDQNRDKPKPPTKKKQGIPPEPSKPEPQKSEKDKEREEEARERETRKSRISRKRTAERRRSGKITVTQALSGDYGERRSYKKKRRSSGSADDDQEQKKIVRDVVIPDVITVQELANRMAEQGSDVVKTLMKLGMMVTINQSIDGDTAELVVEELGHKVNRVSESDVEADLGGVKDTPTDMEPRSPVVTVMGHVDHGKTSLLDALRKTDVASGESGGITQHIGAYQIETESHKKITFIDTPGHAAFTEMRSRGADITDIVILVVAADDGVMPQTIEAINHAKAAEVPIIVAVNKIDLPGADPNRIKTELLQHELVVEDMGGDIISVDVSAIKKTNLEQLEEAILLQSEIMELKANPQGVPEGAVVEARMEQGRGNVATVIIKRGQLKVGQIFVAGKEWGKVKALNNEHGERVEAAGPSTPVEVLGLNGTPDAGDLLIGVATESKAREVTDYRKRKARQAEAALRNKEGTKQKIFDQIKAGQQKTLPVIVKADVHGSVEAICAAFGKINDETDDEVAIKVIHSAVGAINESDITLANTSEALVIGFNVRANAQARQLARRDSIDISYYSVIYNVLDDTKALLGGLLAPEEREKIIGYAEVRDVFNITGVGKVAGCYVTEGEIKRGAKARLLRDDVVVYEGELSSLQRFKDEVKEVKQGYECGVTLENFDDIKVNDKIEAYIIEEFERTI